MRYGIMFALLVLILLAAALLGTSVLVAYRLMPLQQAAVTLSRVQKNIIYFIVTYPLAYIILLLLFGTEHNVPNTKHHIPSAFIFICGHAVLAIMAIVICIYLTRRNKANIIFLVANSLAALLYISIILLLLQMGLHHSTL